ncbi:MAG: hypothetical protein JJT99_13665 [Rhodobacteraceae bacterium]|nr:hypothetical protein [Paracoccaceae bacterium]
MLGVVQGEPVKVLLDNNLRSLAIFLNPVSKRISGHQNRLALLKARDKPDNFKAVQIESIPTIAHLERRGDISIFTYRYLHLEAILRPHSYPHHRTGDLLRDCQLKHLKSPLNHNLLHTTDIRKQKKNTIDLVNILLSADSPEQIRFLFDNNSEIDIVEGIKVLRIICKSLHQNHYDDAFHYWTGIVSKVNVFLTADKRFRNALLQNPECKELDCKAMLISEFLEHMGITELIPLPYEYGLTYTVSGLPYE